MREQDIQSQILNVLRRLDSFVWVERNNSGKLKDETGRPITYGAGIGSADIQCSVGPLALLLWLEAKKPKKKQEPHQLAWAARQAQVASARLGNVFKVHSVDDAVTAVLHTYRWGLDLYADAGRMTQAEAKDAYEKAVALVEVAKAQASAKEEARRVRKSRRPKRQPLPPSARAATMF
jgi:hypothetical protein